MEAEAVSPVTTKKAPAVKSAPAVKRAPAKKALAKRAVAKKAVAVKRAAPGADYPRHAVDKALRIPKALYDQGATRGATVAEAAQYTTGGKVTGPFNSEVASAKKYGFLRSDAGKLVLEDRARQAIAPQRETDRISALRDAVQDAPGIAAVYAEYRGENRLFCSIRGWSNLLGRGARRFPSTFLGCLEVQNEGEGAACRTRGYGSGCSVSRRRWSTGWSSTTTRR
jgi:hypothetical protein